MIKRNLIVNFHIVNDPAWFETVILQLKSKYRFVDVGFFEERNNYEKKGFCHITFDDGDKTFYTVAYPILKKYGVPATIFVSPKSVTNQSNFWFQEVSDYRQDRMLNIISKQLSLPLATIEGIPFKNILKCLSLDKIEEVITVYQKETNTPPKRCLNMNLDEIMEVEQSGLVTIGAHTLNHPILRNESDENSDNEISGSITELQSLLGHEVRYFAYPNGIPVIDFGEREIKYLRKNNIAIAVSIEPKFISEDDNKLAFPRVSLSPGDRHFTTIKLMLGAKWERIKSLMCRSETKNRQNLALRLEKARNHSILKALIPRLRR